MAAIAGLRNGGKAADGKTKIVMPSEIVNAENAEEFYFADSIY